MTRTIHSPIIRIAGVAWLAAVAVGLSQMWAYESAAGAPARPPLQLDSLTPRPALPTLLVLLHPHCPCSLATVDELANLMRDCRDRLSVTVLMVRPEGAAPGWEHTDLWR